MAVEASDDGRGAAFAGRAVAVAMLVTGAALLAIAGRCDRAWFERHVALPFYFAGPPRWPVVVRLAAAAFGVAALAGAVAVGRRMRAMVAVGVGPATWVAMFVALLASLVVVEGTLRIVRPRWREAAYAGYEMTIGRAHPRYGWAAEPVRVTRLTVEGRSYEHAVGPSGLRVRGPGDAPDFGQPSLLVVGESIAGGYGLDYDDTFAVRCARALGLEPVIVAEGGYGFDQAYLRASDLLPKLERPVAVVTVFVPSQLGRSLREDRPRLLLDPAGRLELVPADTGWLARTRLATLFRRIPVAGEAALERSLALARAVFVATATAARAGGARPLFVAVSHGPTRAVEAHPEAAILRAVFVETGLPFVVVDLDVGERFATDGHPNAAGARRIANAIEAALR